MEQGDQTFLDRILDKRATFGETMIMSIIIGFPIYYFWGDVTTLEEEGRFALIIVGFPILIMIRKLYWSFRMKGFLVRNIYYLKGNNKEAFLRYYHNHTWRNVYYYFGFIKNELEKYDSLGRKKFEDPGWWCHRCGEFNSIQVTRCNKCTQRKNKPVAY
ncbi:hypothetical protein [Neobacillus niacini]|uniref:hypothetical protein n=1 Tax=Neobacillus niacini TaxID=86668 RepID=UPI0021CB4E04|nr:hypothetical protein [Neobacillus niacini]MCM3763921.1 hypothetical protein [Neobacillus niacini]